MSKYWEIVQLSDGSFALQSSDDNEPPLVRIEFSAEAESMLQGQVSDVARIMIGAGVQAVSHSDVETSEADASKVDVTLH